jgi:hypothetical protein
MDCRVKPGNDELAAQNRRKMPAFPCHFDTLGLKARHVRSPRTPGGLLSDATGPLFAAFNFLETRT